MKKIVKVLLVLLCISGVLFASGIALIKKLLPPEKIREKISQEVASRFHREIEIGKIEIGLLKGIVVENFALSEYPNFKSGTFLESKKFSLKFQLWPLLKKKVVVDSIELASPKIRIVRNLDGKTFNFSDLIQSSSPTAATVAAPKKEEAASPLSLTISKAAVSQGKIEYIDKTPQKIKLTLSPINLVTTGTGLDKPMSVDFTFTLDSFLLGKDLSGKCELKSVLELPKEKIQINSLKWAMNFITLESKGTIEHFKDPTIEMELLFSKMDLGRLADWITLPKGMLISGSPTTKLYLKGNQNLFNYSAQLDLTSTEASYANIFKKDSSTKFQISLDGKVKDKRDIAVDSARVQASQMEAQLKGEIKNISGAADPIVKLSLQTNPFNLSEIAKLLPLSSPYKPAGTLTLGGEISGPFKFLKAKGEMRLENGAAQYEKLGLQSLQGKVEFTEDSLSISSLSGKISSEGKIPCEFTAQTTVKNFINPEIYFSGNIPTLDVSLFLPDKKDHPKKDNVSTPAQNQTPAPYKGPEIKARGDISIGKLLYSKFEAEKLEAHWNLTGLTPVLDRLNGSASIAGQQGKIQKIPLLLMVAPILKTDPSSLGFSSLGGHFLFDKGTAHTEDFKVLSQACDLSVKGSLFLPTQKPNLSLTAKLPKGSLSGGVGEWTADSEGRPTFVFLLKESWKPSVDTSQMGKKAVEKAKEEIKKKAAEVLENEGKKLLNNLFGR